jgi:glycosyltransferase involved in cell wall biosynthesis
MLAPNQGHMHSIPVLHIITRLIVGGAQENTIYTAAMLDPARFQVEILSGPQTGSEGSLIEEGRSKGVKITILPSLVRQVNPWMDLKALWQMVGYLRKNRYSIVHTHSSKAGILGRISAKLAGIPVIIHTVHGWSFHDHMTKVTKFAYILLERFCARFTDALIVVTDRDEQKGLQAGIGKRDQYHKIRSAIPLQDFDLLRIDRQLIRKELGIPINSLVLGTVGRFSAQKNPIDWVNVAEKISQEIPDCRFLMVGDGPLLPQVKSMLLEKKLENKFYLPGIQRNIPQMMAAMDVFLLTSLWEGLPRVIPQAMSMRLPVVATSVDGSTEIIVDGLNGYLCPPGNVNCLAESCLKLFKDSEVSQAISQKGHETALENFDLCQMIAQIDDLYNHFLIKNQASTEKYTIC